ncbi:MAG: radical SAM family heme chaperone HemW [Sedimenticolaceae bacterium]
MRPHGRQLERDRGALKPSSALQIPLSLYVHIPWCVHKCPYCDFNSHAVRAPLDHAAYVYALLSDLDHELARQPLPQVGSIFIGGGTPSLFDGPTIERLLQGVAQRLVLDPEAEITLEANPGTAEAANFAGYRAAGVNRLSIGAQSLDDANLAALGRIHSVAEARNAYRLARDAGFDNINLDLMYGLPEQDMAAALADLAGLITLGPEHISWYQLTLEPNTLFHHRPPPLPDHDSLADMMDAGQVLLAQAGYLQYEISAYALSGRRCRHNLNYWQFGDYLGIGAGAHGKLSAADGAVHRRSKQRQPEAYLDRAAAGAVAGEREVSPAELPVEFFLNALRLPGGVPAELFEARTGLPLHRVAGPLSKAREIGLMMEDPARLQPTARGLLYLNDLLALFEPG